MAYAASILNVTVTTAVPIESSDPHANLYGMMVKANPNNAVNVTVGFTDDGPVITLEPGQGITFDPAQAPNTGCVYVAASDGASSSVVEVLV